MVYLATAMAHARIAATNPTNPDAWCVYGGSGQAGSSVTGAETCVDYSGNIVPTVTATQTLGTSLLYWSNIYAVSETVSGAQTTGSVGTADAAGKGNATLPTALTVSGNIDLTPAQIGSASGATTGIWVSTTIPVISGYEILLSSGSNLLMTSVPTISTRTVPGTGALIPNGTMLVLTSTSSAVITLQSGGTLTNSGLRLGAATRAITIGNQLTLIWNATIGQWVEAAFSAGTGN